MEDKRWLTIVLGTALTVAGCEDRENAVGVPPTIFPREETLHVGGSVRLSTEGSTIMFEKVTQDSRCPIGALCIWEGDAAAKLRILGLVYSTRECTLHTALSPKFVVVDSLYVTMKDLLPYRKEGVEVLPSEYILTLQVDNHHIDQTGGY